MLPNRRLELQLAQLAAVIARVNGNKDVTLRDFLFEPYETSHEEVAEVFNFKPRKKHG